MVELNPLVPFLLDHRAGWTDRGRADILDLYKRDPKVDVKTCAYYFLKAREPRAGHKPPKGMPVPPRRRRRP